MPKKPAKKATKKSSAKPKMPSALTFEGMQQRLRKFFNEATEQERSKLWNVLSALRGPDQYERNATKRATTGLIRSAFLGETSSQKTWLTWTGEDDLFLAEHRLSLSSTAPNQAPGSHFVSHALSAFSTLGLNWGRVNQRDKSND